MQYNLENRRYIGNKTSLLKFIQNTINHLDISFNSVIDPFAGTGVISKYFLEQGKSVILNDNLYSNFVFYNAWLGKGVYDTEKIENYLNIFNSNIVDIQENYFSDTFSGTYYHKNDAIKIGYIREYIEKEKDNLTDREYYILLSSLLYTADKIANTVGHFEAFLSSKPKQKGVYLKNLNIIKYKNEVNIYNKDANELVIKNSADLAYIDPPYNARQYVNFYHVLENLAEWNKPEVFGKTLKMERQAKKSKYSWSKAPVVFEDLIINLKVKYILVSYNNTYQANSGASINKISPEEIFSILSKKGEVFIFEKPYKSFNAGKTHFENHKEFLYCCKTKEI